MIQLILIALILPLQINRITVNTLPFTEVKKITNIKAWHYSFYVSSRPNIGECLFGNSSTSEGESTKAFGENSHVEGVNSIAIGRAAHAEGVQAKANGTAAHSEGFSSEASGGSAHAEGYDTEAKGYGAHSEGFESKALSDYSHAQNFKTTAQHVGSTTMGGFTTSSRKWQTVVGANNKSNSKALFIVGDGKITTSNTKGEDPSNAFEVLEDGSATLRTMGTTDKSVATKKYVDSKITFGTEVPSDSVGNIGDIYIMINE